MLIDKGIIGGSSLAMQVLATAPTPAANGLKYLDTTLNKERTYINGAWQNIATESGVIQNQTAILQTANFNISGTGSAGTFSSITNRTRKLTFDMSIGAGTDLVIENALQNNNSWTVESSSNAINANSNNAFRIYANTDITANAATAFKYLSIGKTINNNTGSTGSISGYSFNPIINQNGGNAKIYALDCPVGKVKINGIPNYIDNTAALAAGLVSGDLYYDNNNFVKITKSAA